MSKPPPQVSAWSSTQLICDSEPPLSARVHPLPRASGTSRKLQRLALEVGSNRSGGVYVMVPPGLANTMIGPACQPPSLTLFAFTKKPNLVALLALRFRLR